MGEMSRFVDKFPSPPTVLRAALLVALCPELGMYLAVDAVKKRKTSDFFILLKFTGWVDVFCQSSGGTENKKQERQAQSIWAQFCCISAFSTFIRGSHMWLVWEGRWPWQELAGGVCMCVVPVLRLHL